MMKRDPDDRGGGKADWDGGERDDDRAERRADQRDEVEEAHDETERQRVRDAEDREDDPGGQGGQDADKDVAERVLGHGVLDVDDHLAVALLVTAGQ